MPPKREAVALQRVINNQEQWDEAMGVEGVMLIDIYQKWCGPCKAVVGLFKRLKNEIGDDLLHFAVAEADGIESLEKYRGRCEPCFLFFCGGQLTHVVRGSNAPALQLSITTQLTAEHKVLEEGAERKVIRDPLLAAQEEEEKAAEMAAEEERKKMEDDALKPQPKKVTVAVIKPDAVKNGLVNDIVGKMESEGIEILAQEERTLTEDEAREFYAAHKDEDHFEDLVKFMSSGPVHTLVLTKGDTGEDIIPEVRTLIGPADVELAKEEAPGSIRAVYGTDKITNAVHAADSEDAAAMELAFFFPKFAAPIVPGTGAPPQKERTLAIIRPDALRENKDAIIEKIQEAGFEVALQKEIVLSEDQVKELYKEHEGQDYYDALVANMTSGPVLVLGLAREDAIQGWRDMLGPKEVEVAKQEAPESLRAQFSVEGAPINSLHGSDTPEAAEKEFNYFFPMQNTLAVIKPDAVEEHKEAILERIKEAGFNIAVSKETQMTKELAQQLYKEHEGKDFYDSLTDHMASGPSMIMVLSREDAVTGFRDIMGPPDPDVAKEQVPESLRALLGKDILQNAIHASSNPDNAVEKIKEFFPEVEFNPDGTVKGEEADLDDGEGEEEYEEEEEEMAEQDAEEEADDDGDAEVKAEEKQDEGGEAPEGGDGEEQGETQDEGAEPADAPAAEEEEQAADEEEQQPADGGEEQKEEEGEIKSGLKSSEVNDKQEVENNGGKEVEEKGGVDDEDIKTKGGSAQDEDGSGGVYEDEYELAADDEEDYESYYSEAGYQEGVVSQEVDEQEAEYEDDEEEELYEEYEEEDEDDIDSAGEETEPAAEKTPSETTEGEATETAEAVEENDKKEGGGSSGDVGEQTNEEEQKDESGEQAETPAGDDTEQKDDEGVAEGEDKEEQQQEEQAEAAADEEKTEEAAAEGEETKENVQEVEGGEQKESEA